MTAQTQYSKRPKKRLKKQTLADQVAESIKGSILAGELAEGDVLPTEPMLCEQFGVSRAVVRDATRILMAQGLVDVKQGSGVYVTPARNASFGEALLLSLRRMNATAWDVEEFERILLPEVTALAAASATDADIAAIQRRLDEYLTVHAAYALAWRDTTPEQVPAAETAELEECYYEISKAIFDATHNQVLRLLADPLTLVHAMRRWEGPDITAETIVANEREIMNAIVNAIADRDQDRARAVVAGIQRLPAEAVEAMRSTPIGEPIDIKT